MTELSSDDFPSFYEAIHSFQPYAWQCDLLNQVVANKEWPSLIDLPTGAGKTSVLDIAVFALALDLQSPQEERWAPRRIVMVVDRRVIVKQADSHEQKIAYELNKAHNLNLAGADDTVVSRVAELLRSASSGKDSPPITTSTLRGGIILDESWAKHPDVPSLISSTVDQVGSRLLFRGYGISNGMAPIHAGLLGNDTLFFLDEVHLSKPFADTLRKIESLNTSTINGYKRRWQVVELSATPGADSENKFPKTPLKSGETSSSQLDKRLRASKPTRLVAVKVPADPEKSEMTFSSKVASETASLLSHSDVHRLGVVVNRVETARRVAEKLRKQGIPCTLITGRMRPIDREIDKQFELDPWMAPRDSESGKKVLVSTQCIEAGADLDFDALVTECASIDSLRQRFGRVDRRGDLSFELSQRIDATVQDEKEPLQSVVILRGEKPPKDDPIYGDALAATWNWLSTLEAIDFGIEKLTAKIPLETIRDGGSAPLLTKLHLDAFSHTAPRPANDHVVSRWLHGDQQIDYDVSVVWRADIDDDLLIRATVSDDSSYQERMEAESALNELKNRIAACPPVSIEAVSVSSRNVKAWLRKPEENKEDNSSDKSEKEIKLVFPPEFDVEGIPVEEEKREEEKRNEPGPDRVCIRWTSDKTAEVIKSKDIRAGDTLIVPALRGGLDGGTWDPDSTTPVTDRATEAHYISRNKIIVRLSPQLFQGFSVPSPQQIEDGASAKERKDLAVNFLDEISVNQLSNSEIYKGVITELKSSTKKKISVLEIGGIQSPSSDTSRDKKTSPPASDDSTKAQDPITDSEIATSDEQRFDRWFIITAPRELAEKPTVTIEGGEYEARSFIGGEVPLQSHLIGVGERAELFAQAIGLPEKIVDDLRIAGELHDIGKADIRFQNWLYDAGQMVDNSPIPHNRPLIAKSLAPQTTRELRKLAREKSGYPQGARHELQSIALMRSNEGWKTLANDADLVEHLVASHHGHCRPLAPVWEEHEPQSVLFTQDSKVSSAESSVVLECIKEPASSAHNLFRMDSGFPENFERLTKKYGWHGLALLEAVIRLADHRRSEFEALQVEGQANE